MKKIYLLAAAVGMAGVASAQTTATSFQKVTEQNGEVRKALFSAERAAGDVLFEDDFATTTDWTVTDDGIGSDTWLHQTAASQNMTDYMGAMASTTAGNGHFWFNGIDNLLAGNVDPQDSKLAMNVNADCSGAAAVSLQFEQRYRPFNTDETWVEVSTDGGVSWPNTYEINAAIPFGETTQNTIILNIAGAGSTDVRVRFRWICTSDDDQYGSGFGWAVDDVKIIETWNNDHKIVNAYPTMGAQNLDYYQIPTSQIAPITFTGEVCNNGAADQTASKFNANVTGMETFTTASTPGILAVSACDSVSGLTQFTPSAGTGDYNVAMYFDATETEEVTDGDTINRVITITDDVYSRDNGLISGRISNVSSQPGLSMKIGNIMDINADMTVGYVQVGIASQSGTAVGQLINVEIQKYNSATDAYEYLMNSADYTVAAGDEGALVEIQLSDNVDLVAGDDILVMAGHYGGTDEVAFMYAQTTFEQTVIGYTDDGNSFSLLDPGAIIVRLVEKEIVDQSINENNVVASTSVYPNPANDVATVNFQLNEVANVSIEVVDYTGKVISTENLGSVSNGAHTVNTSNVAEGIYFVNLVVNGNVTTNKLVVSKK